MTCKNIHSATSSPGSADGPMRSVSPAGPTTAPSGRAVARASLTARQALEAGLTTRETCGGRSDGLSPSANLQSSLENRLRARMGAHGSPEYVLTWKHWDMESGPPICALRASAPRISVNGYGGWPTPMAGSPGTDTYNPAGNTDSGRKTVALAGWNTPRATDGKNGGPNQAGGALSHDASLAGRQAWLSRAATDGPGALNPTHSRWLMGFPPVWDACGVMAMRSSRKSRRKS